MSADICHRFIGYPLLELIKTRDGEYEHIVYVVRWVFYEGSHIVGVYADFDDAWEKKQENTSHLIEAWGVE